MGDSDTPTRKELRVTPIYVVGNDAGFLHSWNRRTHSPRVVKSPADAWHFHTRVDAEQVAELCGPEWRVGRAL